MVSDGRRTLSPDSTLPCVYMIKLKPTQRGRNIENTLFYSLRMRMIEKLSLEGECLQGLFTLVGFFSFVHSYPTVVW